ncbi:MAG: T9SS type A sorting domain-containing protein, partial [Bacteroidota bacterium]
MITIRIIILAVFSIVGTSIFGQDNNSIFIGSRGAGYDQWCFVQQTNNSIFTGSPGRGYGQRCFIQATNSSIFSGAEGSGYDQWCFTPSTNNSIFLGARGDGYDRLSYTIPNNNSIFSGSLNSGYRQNCEVLDPISLPVELLSFSGQLLSPDEALLSWSVATEFNNAFFVLERSVDGRAFEEVAIVVSLGNTDSPRTYEYLDGLRAIQGQPVVYYRLKQVDTDGSYTYTDVIALNLPIPAEEQEYLLYPNPAKEQLFLRYAKAQNAQVQVELFDNLGRAIQLELIDGLDLELGYPMNLNHLPEGSYH